tara:strand:+ start:188 stop:799 length:612 start_codon:yes stop_codon:yes gene_type:complete
MSSLKYHHECIFPTLIHVIETQVDPEIKDYCLSKKLIDPIGMFLSNEGGWQSKQEYGDSIITDKLYELFNQSLQQSFLTPIKIIGHWININKPNSFNAKHNHPQSDLAGVYYVEVPKNSGDIYFETPQHFLSYSEIESYTPPVKEMSGQHTVRFITPQKGLLLVFPAHLQHGVLANKSKEDRISISFNMKIAIDPSVHPSGDA